MTAADGYRGDIRDGDIQALAERVTKSAYNKYVRRIRLKKVRAFEDREVSFDFPVTALVGPNGAGKTTVLGAAGLIYKDVQPRRFFAKSAKYDASMLNWRIEYDLIDKGLQQSTTQRTASFRQAKWNRDALARDVLVFGVTRTVPASERLELRIAAGPRFTAKSEEELTQDVVKAAEWILGKKIEGFSRLFLDQKGRVTLLTAKTPAGNYSEFHFGAGEASIIKMISGIERVSDNSLILIEEIENGLHPVATRRMVEYLLDVAKRKGAQVIFTTHSNDALDPLPDQAIWSVYGGEVLQGKLDIRALRTLTGETDAVLAIYVEDSFAEAMVATALRSEGVNLDGLRIHGMGGEANARIVNKQRNLDPAKTFPSICILDGDQAGHFSVTERVFLLPGETSPDAYVFEVVRSNLNLNAARLTVALGLPIEEQGRVVSVVGQRALTNQDRHVVYAQIGGDLGFIPESYVKQVFLNEWVNATHDSKWLVDQLTEVFSEVGIIASEGNAK
ncbi:ATP-dependent endonuclease [Amycolatopsis sp. CA-128772]|uniref:ATP-dependent nuclease n=1 Tax=Amycolatopsis sp. CA-128772 TaxID=2073159 RepID=UPI000CD14C3D|nr:AAA family ATPase [Amycolatopsis sp. CA-128772]